MNTMVWLVFAWCWVKGMSGWLDSAGTSCLCSLWCSVFEEVVTSLLVLLGFWVLDQGGTSKIKIFFSCIHRLLTFQICSLMLFPNEFGHIHSYPWMHETCGLHIRSVWNMNTGGPEAKRSVYPSLESYKEDIDTLYAERSWQVELLKVHLWEQNNLWSFF